LVDGKNYRRQNDSTKRDFIRCSHDVSMPRMPDDVKIVFQISLTLFFCCDNIVST
jgi:hypothetical protein